MAGFRVRFEFFRIPEFGFGSISALRGSDSDRFRPCRVRIRIGSGPARFGFISDRPPHVQIRIGDRFGSDSASEPGPGLDYHGRGLGGAWPEQNQAWIAREHSRRARQKSAEDWTDRDEPNRPRSNKRNPRQQKKVYVPLGRTRAERTLGRMGMACGPTAQTVSH